MDHLERMQAIRRHVDTIIEQSKALEGLARLPEAPIEVVFTAPAQSAYVASKNYSVTLPVDELREIVQRRIAEAEAEIRKLGMVAPSPPGSNVLDRVRPQPSLGPSIYPDPRQPAPADLANLGS